MSQNCKNLTYQLSVHQSKALTHNSVLNLHVTWQRRYLQQHLKLEQLNQQAHHSAMSLSDEFVIEACITYDKLPTVVRELLLIEAWKQVTFFLLNISSECPHLRRTVLVCISKDQF